MAVRFEQLMQGGRAYLKESVSRPGAPSEFRLKPVKVHSVERGAAFVEVLDTGNKFTTKFSNLEPDLEWLKGQLEKVNARRVAPSNDVITAAPAPRRPEPVPEPEAKPWPAWPPRLGEIVKAAPPEPVKAEPLPVVESVPPPVPVAEPWDPEELAPEAPKMAGVATPLLEETRRQMTSRENSKKPRRHFTPEQIAEGVGDILSGMTRKQVCEKWGIYSVTYTGWLKRAEAERARLRLRERRAAKQIPTVQAVDTHQGINGTDRQVLEPARGRGQQTAQLEEDNDRLKGVVKMLIEKRPYTVPDMEAQSRALMRAIGALLEVGT